MKISELSRTVGVPVATVKYYLREGLLPPGVATSATQASYDETHARRLRLVRALVDVGGLPLAAVRDVLAALDAGPAANLEAVGVAHGQLPPLPPALDGDPARASALVEQLGWSVYPDSPALHRLETALQALAAVGLTPGPEQLAAYAEAALQVARSDIDSVPDGPIEAVVEHVVVGTILLEPLLLTLRRLAQQHLFVARRPDG